jgi:hypothetical protein
MIATSHRTAALKRSSYFDGALPRGFRPIGTEPNTFGRQASVQRGCLLFHVALSNALNQLALRSSCERWEISMTLEKMPTGKLQSLRAEVEAMIATKVAARRQELESWRRNSRSFWK